MNKKRLISMLAILAIMLPALTPAMVTIDYLNPGSAVNSCTASPASLLGWYNARAKSSDLPDGGPEPPDMETAWSQSSKTLHRCSQ